MLAMWVKVRIKPDQRKRFLEAIEADALGSERDEPGCLRFNVLQDEKDANVYYFFEVYKALEPHKDADVRGWDNRDAALVAIDEARRAYAETHAG